MDEGDVEYEPANSGHTEPATDRLASVGSELFVEQDGRSMSLWVHPDLPDRSEIVDRIKVVRLSASIVFMAQKSDLIMLFSAPRRKRCE